MIFEDRMTRCLELEHISVKSAKKAKHAGLGLSSSDDQQALSSLVVASGSQYESDDVYKFSDITDCAPITGTPDTR